MLKCREVVDNADQLIDGTMSRRQRLAINMHLLICVHCRRYMRQLQALLRAIPLMHGQASEAEVSRVMNYINDHQE